MSETTVNQSRFSRLRQAFREHTGIKLSTATAIVYAGLSLVFGIKAAADRPNNTVPILQCTASICLSAISAYGAKNNYHGHFRDLEHKATIADLEERTRQLQDSLNQHIESLKSQGPPPPSA